MARPIEDRAGRDGSRIALVQTEAGRYLRVIYVPDPTPGSVLSSRRTISATTLRRPCGGARRRHNGRSHDETKSIPSRLERRPGATGAQSLRNAIRHRSCGLGRSGVPIDDDDRDEDPGQARSGRQSAIGETPSQLIDMRPNISLQPTAAGEMLSRRG